MNYNIINGVIKEKFGDKLPVNAFDYMAKIIQLPFHIPKWDENTMWKFVTDIISNDMKGTRYYEVFSKNKDLLLYGVKRNPREIKRFINNILFAESAFGESVLFFGSDLVRELIVVQALQFRSEWQNFLDFITPDERRKEFLNDYKNRKGKGSQKEMELYFYNAYPGAFRNTLFGTPHNIACSRNRSRLCRP
jgi:hypothetical protein